MTSSSTTTTISTTTICWKSTANGFSAAACRKKRSLVLKNTDTLEKRDEEISATKSLEGYGDPLLDSSIDKKLNEETERNARLDFSWLMYLYDVTIFARFALYWRTTTLTYSTTSYTGTSTLASLYCTPSIWTYAQCWRRYLNFYFPVVVWIIYSDIVIHSLIHFWTHRHNLWYVVRPSVSGI